MEAIVKMSSLSGARMFARSNLPPASALNLHVTATDFMKIVRESPQAVESSG
jgi:hypothetical protein